MWEAAKSTPLSIEIVTRGRRIFSNSNEEREEMEHAIDNKEIGFIVFSKLTGTPKKIPGEPVHGPF